LAVAESLAFDSSQFVDACFWAVNEGLLVLVWDILCPVCRIPAQMIDTLREIRNHGRCDACNLDYELDFANSVELIFRAHPEVRTNELGTFCIGGPVHSPHVAAQIRVAANEEFELQLNLGEGRYKLRGPQLPYSVDFRVSSAGRVSRMELPLSRRPSSESMRIMTVGQQSIVLMNDTSQEILVRVERTAPRENALTAARATSLPLFRQLFPAERLSPGQLISIAQISLVATDLPGTAGRFSEMGDARSFALLQEHFRWLEEAARSEGGALVKTTAAGALLAFHDPLSATRTASLLASTIGNFTPELATSFRAAVHRGTALSATINDRIDYFGTTVSLVQEMLTVAHQSEIVLSSQIIGDAQVSEFLSSTRAHLVADSASLPSGKLVLQRLRIS
jgi:class 3 adenylate cyclase